MAKSILLSYAIAVLCSSAHSDERSWSAKMQEMSQILPEILVDVSKPGDSQLRRLKVNAKRLADVSKSVANAHKTKLKGPIDKDPSIKIFSKIFQKDATYAHVALQQGKVEYAKSALRSMASYCIGCHTRDNFGPRYPKMNFKVDVKGLSPMEKGDLYTATRQFDRALKEYRKVINSSQMRRKKPFLWARAVKQALAVSIRVNNDPKAALSLIKGIPKSTKSALYLNAYIGDWKKDLKNWQREKSSSDGGGSSHLKKARDLVQSAQKAKSFPADQNGTVLYLRASAEVHKALRSKLKNRDLAEAFLLAGQVYESIDVLRKWAIPEAYYESCIESYPKSALAEKCYLKFEENVYVGYSGSGGSHIPADIETRMGQLRRKAYSKNKKL